MRGDALRAEISLNAFGKQWRECEFERKCDAQRVRYAMQFGIFLTRRMFELHAINAVARELKRVHRKIWQHLAQLSFESRMQLRVSHRNAFFRESTADLPDHAAIRIWRTRNRHACFFAVNAMAEKRS